MLTHAYSWEQRSHALENEISQNSHCRDFKMSREVILKWFKQSRMVWIQWVGWKSTDPVGPQLISYKGKATGVLANSLQRLKGGEVGKDFGHLDEFKITKAKSVFPPKEFLLSCVWHYTAKGRVKFSVTLCCLQAKPLWGKIWLKHKAI